MTVLCCVLLRMRMDDPRTIEQHNVIAKSDNIKVRPFPGRRAGRLMVVLI